MSIDPRTVDRDGFVIGYDYVPFGQRPSVGGLGSCVQRGDQVGVIVGLDTVPDGLLLHVVWIPRNRTSQMVRNGAIRAYRRGDVEADQVPAEGLIALDADLPTKGTP